MQLFPIVLIGVLLMADAGLGFTGADPPDHGRALVATIGGVLGLVGLAAAGIGYCRHQLTAKRRPAAVVTAERITRIARGLLLVHFAVVVLAFGWLGTVREAVGDVAGLDDILALLPTLGGFAAIWWIYYPVERRVRDALLIRSLDQGRSIFAMPGRGTWVFTQLRLNVLFLLVPILLILVSAEVIEAAAALFSEHAWAGWVGDVSTLLAAVVIVIAAPLLTRIVLEVEPMPDGPLRRDLLNVCRSHRVSVRELLVWKTHGSMINAAVMGVIGRLRYILMTDALLDAMTREQIEAVMAHEIGHVRRRHMPWLLVSMLAAIAIVVAALLAVQGLPVADSDAGSTVAVLVGVSVVLVMFGWISRRFERQADAFAVRHINAKQDMPEAISASAAAVVCDALGRIAILNSVAPTRRSWRHGSIAWRQAYLQSIVGRPADGLAIDRQVRWIKVAVAVIVGLMLVLVIRLP
jgi:STE24 endopeptidase